MAELTIQETTWQDIVKVARRRKKTPEGLAGEALREFLQRQSDDNLLGESRKAALKAPLDIRNTEELIRKQRKRKS
jgi:hypothetical protein